MYGGCLSVATGLHDRSSLFHNHEAWLDLSDQVHAGRQAWVGPFPNNQLHCKWVVICFRGISTSRRSAEAPTAGLHGDGARGVPGEPLPGDAH